MKRRIMAVACTALCGMLLFGCGKSEEEQTKDALMEELDNSADAVDEFYDVSTENEAVSTDAKDSVQTPEVMTPDSFEALPEWSNYTAEDPVVQVGDMMYTVGCTMEEFVSKLEESAIEYTYEFELDNVYEAKGRGSFYIYSQGRKWLYVSARNETDEMAELKDMKVYSIELSHPNGNFSCQKNSFVLNGMSYDEVKALKLKDVLTMEKDILVQFEKEELDSNFTLFDEYCRRIQYKYEEQSEGDKKSVIYTFWIATESQEVYLLDVQLWIPF